MSSRSGRLILLLLVAIAACINGCILAGREPEIRPPAGIRPRVYTLETTAYCHCGECCGWRRNWLGRPVISSGPNRGRRKAVGITASGTKARIGTIAADTKVFPFGTIMYIPGYGYGRVEDRGSDIKGRHIDLYFPRHSQATRWGRSKRKVKVWKARR